MGYWTPKRLKVTYSTTRLHDLHDQNGVLGSVKAEFYTDLSEGNMNSHSEPQYAVIIGYCLGYILAKTL